jgi:hypothetical protein
VKRVDPDFDVQLTLELARVAREPNHADKQRVLEALQVRLGDMPSLPSAGEVTTGVRVVVPRLNNSLVGARAARFARSLVTSKAAAHLVWVGVAMGGLGFWLGARVNHRSEAPVAAARSQATVAAPIAVPPAELREPPPSSPRAIESTAVPLAVESAPAPSAPASPPRARLDESTRRVQRPPAAARRPEAASRPAALDPDARFLEAVRLLSRAQRALDGGEPGLALVLLGEIDERVPRELLSEERNAALVIALCQTSDLARARRVAAELTAQNPTSIYAARIARSCGNLGEANAEAPTASDRHIAPKSILPE